MKARQAFCYSITYMAEDITRADISGILEQNLMTWKTLFSIICCNFTVHCSVQVESSPSSVKSITNWKHTTGLNFMWIAVKLGEIIKVVNPKLMGNYKLWLGKDLRDGMLYCKHIRVAFEILIILLHRAININILSSHSTYICTYVCLYI
jgi:hypothetical protein